MSQQQLSDYIKKVHIDLRLESRKIGPELAWKNHLEKHEVLEKYAETMKSLATEHWDKNNSDDPKSNRINWIVEECEKYFFKGGNHNALIKEMKLQNLELQQERMELPLKLLDVGSCYNPFKAFPIFDVTAIDLAPATSDVIQCDFLKSNFQLDSFNIIVFSFLLEYLPHPELRYQMCLKAYQFLKPGSILIILTPDSKHQTANSGIMKKWRLALAHIGFLRVVYEKLKHMHGMVFVKMRNSFNIKLDNTCPQQLMIIPSDNNPYLEHTKLNSKHYTVIDSNDIAESFSILPGDNLF